MSRITFALGLGLVLSTCSAASAQSVAAVRALHVMAHACFPELGVLEPGAPAAEQGLLAIGSAINRGAFEEASTAIEKLGAATAGTAALQPAFQLLVAERRRVLSDGNADVSLLDRGQWRPQLPPTANPFRPATPAERLLLALLAGEYQELLSVVHAAAPGELPAVEALLLEKFALARAATLAHRYDDARKSLDAAITAAIDGRDYDAAFAANLLAGDAALGGESGLFAGQSSGAVATGGIQYVARGNLIAMRMRSPEGLTAAEKYYEEARTLVDRLADRRVGFEITARSAYLALVKGERADTLYAQASEEARRSGFLRAADVLQAVHAGVTADGAELNRMVKDATARRDIGAALAAVNIVEGLAAQARAQGDAIGARLRLQMIDEALPGAPFGRRSIEARAALAVEYGQEGRMDPAANLLRDAVARLRQSIETARKRPRTSGPDPRSVDAPADDLAIGFATWTLIAYVEQQYSYELAVALRRPRSEWVTRRNQIFTELAALRTQLYETLNANPATKALATNAKGWADGRAAYFAVAAAQNDNGYDIAQLYMGGQSCADLRRDYGAKHEQARKIPPDDYHLRIDYATFEVTDCGWRGELQKEVEADLQRRDPVGTLMPLVIKRAEAGLSNSELFARDIAAQQATSSLWTFFDMADRLHLGALLEAWSLRMLEFTRREPAAAAYAPMANGMRASALVALERPQEALDLLAASGLGSAPLERQPLRLIQAARAQLGDARASLVSGEQAQILADRAAQQSSGVVSGATAERAALDARQAQGSTLSVDETARLMQLRRSSVDQPSNAAHLPAGDEILAAVGAIPERTTVLIYRWDGGALDVWRAERGKPLGLKRLKLMSSQAIRRLSDALHTALATQKANWFDYSHPLYQQLLEPLDGLPDGNRLVIVGSFVESVPFEVLGPDPQHLLFASHPISYATYVWAGAGVARAGSTGAPLVVGLDGASLSSAESEASLVATEIPGSKTLIGPSEATRARVSQALPAASWVHLATHATLLPNRYLSALALANGEDLEGWMLFELAAGADTVVLSACDTSVEVTDDTQRTGGLSAVLLAGGARRIVATRWEANDRSTTEFMKAFYHSLGTDKLSVDRALQSAHRAVADQQPHPYFFANFSLRTSDLKSALQEGGLKSR